MASDPQADRLRLVVEPEDGDAAAPASDAEEARQRRPEDMIDLGRLAEEPGYQFEDEDEDDEKAPARRRLLPLGLGVLALAGFAAIAWYGYRGVIGGGDEMIPLIQADAGPIKIRPAAPGGMEVPYQDKLVLNELSPDPDKPQVERLLPPPEVPKPPLAQSAPIAAGEQTAPAPEPLAAKTQAAGTTGTQAVQGQRAASDLTPAAAPTIAPPAPVVPTSPAPDPAKAPSSAGRSTTDPAAAAPQPVPKAAAPARTQAAAIPGGYLVQFASLKDKNLAGGEWARLRKAFPDLLADKELVLQEANLGSKGIFHRVRAGYFADRGSAAALCQAIKAKNQACIVVKP